MGMSRHKTDDIKQLGTGKYNQYYYDVFETILSGKITEKKQKHFKK